MKPPGPKASAKAKTRPKGGGKGRPPQRRVTGKRPPERTRLATETDLEDGEEQPDEYEGEEEEADYEEQPEEGDAEEQGDEEADYEAVPEAQRSAHVRFAQGSEDGDEEFDHDSLYPRWQAPFEPLRMLKEAFRQGVSARPGADEG